MRAAPRTVHVVRRRAAAARSEGAPPADVRALYELYTVTELERTEYVQYVRISADGGAPVPAPPPWAWAMAPSPR